MKEKIDLSQLAVSREGPSLVSTEGVRARRHLLARVGLPGLLLAGFSGLVFYALRETFSPPRPVTVVPVIVARADMDLPPDTPLFRAAGWVEPRPTATLVTAMAEGVVEKLLAVEGQEVKQGQLVARLVAADARIALDFADADVHLRESELAAAKAALAAAQTRVQRPVHLKVELADAEASLAKVEADQASLPLQLKAAASRQSAARRDWESRRKASDLLAEGLILKAKSDLDTAEAAVEDLQMRQKRLPALVAALKSKRDALQEKLTGKVDEVRQAAESKAGVAAALARLRQAKSARDAAELKLQRMEIKAPVGGRVLALVARPGMRLTGLNPGSLQDSSTVLTLYDPASLQVRVDVRLDDVVKVQSGQKVRIETAVAKGLVLEGRVLLATSQADIQKNTLSIKAAVLDPPSGLRPDMLCQVTFLAPPRAAATGSKEDSPYRMLLPRQLLDTSSGGTAVWVADLLTGQARLRPVEIGLAAGDLVEIVSGLSTSDKPIVGGREGLREGMPVRVVGEDETLGITRSGGAGPKGR